MFYEGCTEFEIESYRELEGEVFDFGTGQMRMEGLLGSEDAYYEMDLQEHSEIRKQSEFDTLQDTAKEPAHKENKMWQRKAIDQEKMRKLQERTWEFVWDRGSHLQRSYYSRRRKVLLRVSNKKVRKYRGDLVNGSHYKRVYDLYWNLF